MLINARFTKTEEARFISHIDLLRALGKTLRRAEIPVAFSQGFNPHMLVNLSAPLALGIASVAEYLTVHLKTPLSPADFSTAFNAVSPTGIRIIEAKLTDKNQNYAANIAFAEYKIPCKNAEKISALDLKNMRISYTQKGEQQTKEVGTLINSLSAGDSTEGKTLTAVLSAGNTPLRPDRFFTTLYKDYSAELAPFSALRTRQFDKNMQEVTLG